MRNQDDSGLMENENEAVGESPHTAGWETGVLARKRGTPSDLPCGMLPGILPRAFWTHGAEGFSLGVRGMQHMA